MPSLGRSHKRFPRRKSHGGLHHLDKIYPCGSSHRIRIWDLCRCFSDVSRSIRELLGSMAIGAQHLPGSASGIRAAIWIDAGSKRRPSRPALRQGGYEAASKRNAAMRGGERCLSLGRALAGRLQPTNPGHRHHVHGATRGGCGSIHSSRLALGD